MKTLSEISRNWAKSALAIAKQQGFLPNSPAEIRNGELQLCAAACVAYAGLKIMSPGRERDLYSSLMSTNNKQTVLNAFAELGLSLESYQRAMLINDQTEPERRIEVLRLTLGL